MSRKTNIAAEAMQAYGYRGISDHQLLQCIGLSADAVNGLMTKAEGYLANVAKMTLAEISGIKGIGMSKAAAILAAIELGRRRQLESKRDKCQLTSSLDAYDILRAYMSDLIQEEFWVILLDRRSQVLKVERIHIGGMSAMAVDPRIIFIKALEYKACSIILSHNHPTGAPSPSNEDIRLTEKIRVASQYLDIKILDHIIVGDGCYYSFADEGKI